MANAMRHPHNRGVWGAPTARGRRAYQVVGETLPCQNVCLKHCGGRGRAEMSRPARR
jgi:hypothetical protein